MTAVSSQRTLSILKPDATARSLTGAVNVKFEQAGLKIVAQKRLHLTYDQAAEFYAVHSHRPFFKDLCTIMSAGPVVVQVLEGEQAVEKNRQIMGATNPKEAEAGTIRQEFGISIDYNTVHGSDSPETEAQEIAFFFAGMEICPPAGVEAYQL